MIDVLTKSPFLRTSRSFPHEINELAFEVNKSYVDVAQATNARTIGFFTKNRTTATGENWFFNQGEKQQGLRQVYPWDDTMRVGTQITIRHGIDFNSLSNFVRIWGTFRDSPTGSWQTLPYVDINSVTNQIKVSINSTNIVISKGATAPACFNGLVILEWIANP